MLCVVRKAQEHKAHPALAYKFGDACYRAVKRRTMYESITEKQAAGVAASVVADLVFPSARSTETAFHANGQELDVAWRGSRRRRGDRRGARLRGSRRRQSLTHLNRMLLSMMLSAVMFGVALVKKDRRIPKGASCRASRPATHSVLAVLVPLRLPLCAGCII